VRWAQAVTGRVGPRFLGDNRCNRSSGGVSSAAGVGAKARGGAHLEKIGLMNWHRMILKR
jgi:hypothetical protein